MLKKFNHDLNQREVLLFYFVNKEHPGILQSAAWDRYLNFSMEKEMYDRVQAMFPHMKTQNQFNMLAKNYGNFEVDASLTPAEREEQRRKHMEFQRENLYKFEENAAKLDASFRKSGRREREDFLELNPVEEVILETTVGALVNMEEQLAERQYYIDNHFTHREWLKVYGGAVEQGMDVQALLTNNRDSTEGAYAPKWDALGEYANWLADVELGLSAQVSGLAEDCSKFLVQHDAANITQQTLYQGVIAERNARMQTLKDAHSVDRYSRISAAIDDFNAL